MILALLTLLTFFWLTTGTLAPYGASLSKPFLAGECEYPVNIDHTQFTASFMLVDGFPPQAYAHSVVLRRILYPILAYPFMDRWNFHTGGLIANAVILVMTFSLFVWFLLRNYGVLSAQIGAWLLATYPGIFYWSGLPYLYVMIVPCTIACFILMFQVLERPSRWWPLQIFVMGLLFLGYDLIVYFGPALILGLLLKRRWLQLFVGLVLLILPTLGSNWYLETVKQIPLLNSNSGVYVNILNAYMSMKFDSQWLSYFLWSPWIAFKVFFFSNFYFLPALFLLTVLLLRKRRQILDLPERVLLVTGLMLFIGMNWAPHYEGWQMRGAWISRLYQPLFVVYLMVICRNAELFWHKNFQIRRLRISILVLAMILNTSISIGGILSNPLAGQAFHDFYRHSPPEAYHQNIEILGKRPYGICR